MVLRADNGYSGMNDRITTTSIKVALGNNRNDGLSLGSFYVNANNALANVNGNNWRGRASLRTASIATLGRVIARKAIRCLCLNRNHTTQKPLSYTALTRGWLVKYPHTSAVSRLAPCSSKTVGGTGVY